MPYHALTITILASEPIKDQASDFGNLKTGQAEIRKQWKDGLELLLPPSRTETWAGLLVPGCSCHDEALGLGSGIVAGLARVYLGKIRLAMLPVKGIADGGDWTPCGRNCHGGLFALGFASDDLKITAYQLEAKLGSVTWLSNVNFHVAATALTEHPSEHSSEQPSEPVHA